MGETMKTNDFARSAVRGADRIRATSDGESIDAAESWDSLNERITLIPQQARVRGMFFRALSQNDRSARTEERYFPFNSYSTREYAAKLLATARTLHPRLSPANAVFKMGLDVFCVFASSLVGSALFSVAEHDFRRVLELGPRAYALAMSPGELIVTELSSNHAMLQLRNNWLFPDIFQPGVILGAMKINRVQGTAVVTRLSASEADIELSWQSSQG